MAYKQILVDSCSYIRLAGNIFPLLGIPFGNEEYALYIHKDFNKEFEKNPRLVTKFDWLNEERYREERKKKVISITKTQKEIVEDNFEYIWRFKKDNDLGISLVDMYCLATAMAIGIPIVSDDHDLLITAKEFEVETYTTATILKIMLDRGFIDLETIDNLYVFLNYNRDLPSLLQKQYRIIFGKDPPKI